LASFKIDGRGVEVSRGVNIELSALSKAVKRETVAVNDVA